MTTTEISTAADAELPPGYQLEEETGAWLSLPWPGDPRLPPAHPDRLSLLPPSLAPQIFAWCSGDQTATTPALDETRLLNHLTGAPWQFTPAQRRFLHLWYAVREDGRWLYRSGVKRGAKGTGKDPLCAAMCLIEAAGPVVLDGWATDARGRRVPVGRPHRMALVQIAANSEAQAGDVLRVANGMISPDFASEGRADPGVLRTVLNDSSRIELLTSSERSNEGDPATAEFLNESHHMTETSGGQKLAGVARRNAGKSPGGLARVCEFTNGHMPGEGSVAEESYDAWQVQVAGKTRRKDILYDSREAPPSLRLHVEEELVAGIAAAYADSPWTDQERIRDEAQDPRVPPADSIRYYFNALPESSESWVSPRKFDAGARPDLVVADGEQIAMFLDCSKSSDATGLVACRISDGHIITLGVWQRPHGDRGAGWLAPRDEVDAAGRAAWERYDVVWCGVDPSPARDDDDEAPYWRDLIDSWHRDFRKVVAVWATPGAGERRGNAVLFDMRTSMPGGQERNRVFVEAAEQTQADIDEHETLTHDAHPALRTHVHNARLRSTKWGMSLGKRTRDSSKKVDLAVCMVGARLGRRIALNSGKLDKRRKPTGEAVFV